MQRIAADPRMRISLLKPFDPVSLQFGEHDLVYGSYSINGMSEPAELLRQRAGGNLLSDCAAEREDMSWSDSGVQKMEETLANGNKIHFDLSHVDVPGAVGGYGPYARSTTSLELRYLQESWPRFQNNVVFYNRYRVVHPW